MQIKTETRVGLFLLLALGIFFYMTFQISVFRLDRTSFVPYTVYFDDISGLAKKSDVKIAGVKVGWVDDIQLVCDQLKAKADIMVRREYLLHTDAYAVVRQEGLLGGRYLELAPGDPALPQLQCGAQLTKPSRPPVSVDELMREFQEVATNVSSFSEVLGRVVTQNEQNLNAIISDVRDFTAELRAAVPQLSSNIDRSATAFEQAASQAQESMRGINDITNKINDGTGLIGKLINEDETYHDIRYAVQGIKNYLAKVEHMAIVFDSHSELMFRKAENFEYEDSRGYFNMRLHPSEDIFYIVGATFTEKGEIKRKVVDREWFDECGCSLDFDVLSERDQFRFPPTVRRTTRTRNTWKLNAQFGKIYGNFAFRFGAFENTAGVAVDYALPLDLDNVRWITTLEMFDMRGTNRFDVLRGPQNIYVKPREEESIDKRPHLKWLNRIFFFNNLYTTFGADDFISKENANAFIGVGIRFTDDEIKYLLSSVAGGLSLAS